MKLLDFFWFRLEEKLSNTESENQVLRQQALTMSPTGKQLSTRPKTTIIQVLMDRIITELLICHVQLSNCHMFLNIIQRTPENGNVLHGEPKTPKVRRHYYFHYMEIQAKF